MMFLQFGNLLVNPILNFFRSYPEMTTDFEKLIISRSNLSLDSIPVQFSFSRFKNEWIYIYIHLAQNRNVVAFAITLVANVRH